MRPELGRPVTLSAAKGLLSIQISEMAFFVLFAYFPSNRNIMDQLSNPYNEYQLQHISSKMFLAQAFGSEFLDLSGNVYNSPECRSLVTI